MHLSRVGGVVLRQAYLLRSSFSRVLPLFAWVAIDMVLWGFIAKYLNGVGMGSGLNFTALFLGAILLWDFLMRVMQGVTTAFFEDMWSRNFLNFFATPMTTYDYMSGLVLTSIVTSAVGLVVMILLSTQVFDLSFFAYGWSLLPFLLTLFLFGTALGILACAMVLKLGPSAEWFVWPIPAVISPFAGVFYPVATLPAWMQAVAKGLPPAYVFESMRAIVAGQAPAQNALVTGVVLAVCYTVGSAWVFNRTYLRAVKTGLIARYSAESVT